MIRANFKLDVVERWKELGRAEFECLETPRDTLFNLQLPSYLDNDIVDHPQCRFSTMSFEVLWIIQSTSPKRMAWTSMGHR
jgi:hypothetical protein